MTRDGKYNTIIIMMMQLQFILHIYIYYDYLGILSICHVIQINTTILISNSFQFQASSQV